MIRVIKKSFIIVALLCAFNTVAFAEIIGTPSPAGYAWADTGNVEFGWIEISDGTVIGNVGDDNEVYTVNLPFTFDFYSQSFTTMYVSTNGYVTFTDYGNNSFPSNDALPPNTDPDQLIAVFWDNLVLNGPVNGQIYSKTIGTAPYRKHIIEWSNAQLNSSSGTLTFQVILYETTNLIKMQYLDLGTGLNDEIGRNATEGIRFGADVVEYGTNDPVLSEGLAMLFFPLSNLSGTAAIVPTSAEAGTNAQQFRLETTSLTATASFVDNGKADVIRIDNPFSSPISIIDTILVDGNSFFFIQRNTAPTVAEYNFFPNLATWFYDTNSDSLFIRLPPLSIRDDISVSFRANVPTTTGATAVNFDAYTYLNEAGRASLSTSFNVTSSSQVESYSVVPASATVAAGTPLNLTVTALDQFDNPINNTESVTFRALGSSTATFSQDTVGFAGATNFVRTVTDNVVGNFNVRVFDITDANKDAVSTNITVVPAAPAAFQIVSSTDSIEAGATRRLQVRLVDAFGNIHPDSTVSFQILTGDAQFTTGGTSTTDATDATGVAEVDYRASTSTAVGSDQIQVSFGGVTTTITIPLKSGEISYFEINVIGSSTVLASAPLNLEVVARDVFGNGVVNSESYTMSAVGSATATFSPSNTYTFSNDSVDAIQVSDNTAGTFTVLAQLDSDNSRSGSSELLTVTAGPVAELRVRSEAGNTGNDLGGVNISIASTETLNLYAAGYDLFGNYIEDIATVQWAVASGTLTPSPPLTFPFTGSSISFSPAASGSGVLQLSIPGNPGVVAELTGTITVNAGALSFVKIQTDSLDAGTEVGNVPSLDVGATLTVFAVGYDSDDNRIGNISSNWTVSPTTLGEFQGGSATQNAVDSVVFTATGTGNGVIRAEAVSDANVFDQTGVITVNAGTAASILIRSAANNGGVAYEATPLTIDTDTTITLFAASYDAFGNYLADVSVSWAGIGLVGVPAGPASSINFSPTTTQSGQIRTISGLADDTTATITVQSGAISQIRIQDGATGAASEIDTTTLSAGTTLTAFAGGYDSDGNFVSLVSSNWAIEGDGIGVLSTSGPATSTMLTAQTVGNGRLRATQNGGSLTDLTSTLSVVAGAPATLTKIAASDSQAAPINSELPRDIEVFVEDAFSNPVSGISIDFTPLAGGSVNPVSAVTNAEGIAATRWTVHGTATTDSLSAQFSGGVTVPNSLTYYALVSAGSASTLASVGSTTGTGTVGATLGNSFTVQVEDANGNPAEGVLVSFAITNQPSGAENASLSVFSQATNASGQASTQLTLGSRLGAYTVQASTATTTPTFINFTGTANQPAAVDSIVAISGDEQNGTVGQTLGSPIVFRAMDSFGNIVSGAAVNFSSPQGGIITPPSGTTNGSGEISPTWQLGNTVGTQSLTATLTASPTRTATVTADAAAGSGVSLNLISMRQIASDSVAAVPGENISVILEARDAFGNLAPNTIIDFTSAAGFNVGFENLQLTTGADGRVSNIVKTDVANTASFYNATISGVTTLELHIFHLLYVANSLSPASVSPDSVVSFQLSISNTTPAAASNGNVVLDPAATLFQFEDGTNSYSAALTGPVTLNAGGNTQLTFTATQVNPNFANSSYAPIVTLNGSNVYDVLSGQLVLPSNSLRIFSSQITDITAANTVYARGTVFEAFMTVNNDGPDTVNVNTALVTISGFPQSSISAFVNNPTQLLPNTPNNQFGFTITVPGNATPGNYIIDGQFSGTTTSGTVISDGSANNPWNFAVVQNADLSVLGVSPTVVTNGDSFSFSAELLNLGGLTTVLNDTSSFLVFGDDSVALSQSASIPPGSGPGDAVTLAFDPYVVQSVASGTPYPIQLVLSGTENGAPFNATIAFAGSGMLVQNSPNVLVSFFGIQPDSATQGTDGVLASVVLTNSGALNASATLARPDSIRLSTVNGGLGGILPISEDNTLFPLTLAANASSDTINFVIPISTDYQLGLETAQISYGFSDDNSGSGQTVDPSPTTATFTVLSLPEVVLVNASNVLTPQTVTPGLQNVDYRFSLRNDGQGSALINAGDISLAFNNGHTATLTAPTIPQTLDEGEIEEFVFNIDIDPNSSIGNDPIDVTTQFTDEISGDSYSVTYDGLDTLRIITGADPTLLQIQFVQITPENATQGQNGIGANVQLKNLSQSTVQVNTLNLVPERTGITFIRNTPLGTIAAGATALYNFTLNVDAGMTPGTVGIDAGYTATDQTSGQALSDSGAVVPDTLNILTPSAFAFGAITVSPSSVGEGQTGVSLQTTLTNSGQSPVSVNGLSLSYDVGGANITDVLVIPSLPVQLPGGETVAVEFTLDIANPSSYFGPVQASATASGLDLTSSTAVNGASVTPGNFTIVQRANLSVQSIVSVPDSAALGRTDVAVTVRATNTGQGTALLTGSTLRQGNNNFPTSLQTTGFPFTLAQGATQDLLYFVDVPDNIVLNGPDSTIFLGARLQGSDVNTGAALETIQDNLETLTVSEPSDVAFDTLLSDQFYNTGATARVVVDLVNNGGSRLELDGNTQLRLQQTDDATVNIGIPIDLVTSDTTLNPGETVRIESQDIVLTIPGTFRLFIDVNGTTFGAAFSQEVNSSQNISVGGDLFVSQLTVIPNEVSPGDTSISIALLVQNNSLPATVESVDLTLAYAGGGALLIPITRVDTVTEIPQGTATFRWEFDLPLVSPGAIIASADFVLNGGAEQINYTDPGTSFTIVSGIDIAYVGGSISPDSVVNGEVVSFSARFSNSGNTTLLVDPSTSTLSFTDGGNAYQALVDGNFTIRGTQDIIPDTSIINFTSVALDTGFASGIYPVNYSIRGTLPNGDAFEGFDTTAATELTVLPDAEITVAGINIIPNDINRGQTGVQIEYTLRNDGGSPASISELTGVFSDSDNVDITFSWQPTGISPNFPVVISPGATATLTRDFTVLNSVPLGDITAYVTGRFSDTRKPLQSATYADTTVGDMVNVTTKAGLTFSGIITAPDGALDATVSTFQEFTWSLTVDRVPGTGALVPNDSTELRLDFSNRGFYFNEQLTDSTENIVLFPDTTVDVSIWAGSEPRFGGLEAVVIDTSRDASSGEPAVLNTRTLTQPMLIEDRADLTLELLAPSLVDTSNFTARAVVQNIGTAGIVPNLVTVILDTSGLNGIRLSPMTSDTLAVQLDQEDGTRGEVLLTFDGLFESTNDTLIASIAADTVVDANTSAIAFKSSPLDTAVITVINQVAAISNERISEPAGARDGVVSTSQEFLVKADYLFNPTVVDTNTIKSQIIVPDGYNGGNDTLETPLPFSNGSIEWSVIAPDIATPVQNIQLKFTGKRIASSDSIIIDNLLIPVQTVRRAELSVVGSILEPGGALDGVVSTEQFFDIKIEIPDSGQAGTVIDSTNLVTVALPSGYKFSDMQTETTLMIATDGADTLRVQAPDTATTSSGQIEFTLVKAAPDANTGVPAEVIDQTDRVGVVTVERAALTLSFDTNTQFSQNQTNIPVSVILNNTGTAITTPDSVLVRFAVDTLMTIVGGTLPEEREITEYIKLTNNVGQATFTLNALADTGDVNFTTTIIDSDVQDQNNNFPDTLAFFETPEVILPVVVGSGASVQVALAEIIEPAGAVDNTLSTGQRFVLRVEGAYTGNIAQEDLIAELLLPAGAGFLADTLVKTFKPDTTVFWEVFAPQVLQKDVSKTDAMPNTEEEEEAVKDGESSDKKAAPFTLKIAMRGEDGNNPGSVVVDELDFVLELVERANLVLESEIVSGVSNNTVSFGQEFVYQSVVRNNGEAEIGNTPQGQIRLELGDSLQVVQGDVQQPFAIGDSLTWTIRAAVSTQAAKVKDDIRIKSELHADVIRRLQSSQQVNEGGGSASDLLEKQQLEADIDDLYTQLSKFATQSFVRAIIDPVPFDVNTDAAAFVSVGKDSIGINIDEMPEISVLSVVAPQTVSTDQSFNVDVTIEAPGNVINRQATLFLPEGYQYATPGDSIRDFSGATTRWPIMAPENLPSGSESGTLKVLVTGIDRNNSSIIVKDSLTASVTTERRALIDLRSTTGQNLLRITQQQEFVINAVIKNLGVADVNGNGAVQLRVNSPEFQLTNGSTAVQNFTIDNAIDSAIVTWQLVAPADTNINTEIGIGFLGLPTDNNTSGTVDVQNDSLTFFINMIAGQVFVEKFSVERENNFFQGEPDVPAFGLEFTNPNRNETTQIRNFTLSLRDGANNEPILDPETLISRVRVVSEDFYLNSLAGKTPVQDVFGELQITSATANPFVVEFNPSAEVIDNLPTRLVVLMDLASGAPSRKFAMRLDDVRAEQEVGTFASSVEVIDKILDAPLNRLSLEFQSSFITVIDEERESLFRNYPNPFGQSTNFATGAADQGRTRFNFWMESAGTAELRIYTLVGRLVIALDEVTLPRGMSDGDLSWDGMNGQGKRVTNGVYAAVLRLRLDGGQTKELKTKVVYIK
ncbi:MAG: hypothetical protein ACRBF0_02155 [Calditrichia bacterium]